MNIIGRKKNERLIYVIGGKNFKGKEVGLLACCEESDPAVLDGIRIPYERTAALNDWTDMGQVLEKVLGNGVEVIVKGAGLTGGMV